MPTTTYIQDEQQRYYLRQQLLDYVRGSTSGNPAASYTTEADLVDYGVNQLNYPESLVRSVIRELKYQRLLNLHKTVTT